MPLTWEQTQTVASPEGWEWNNRPDDYYLTGLLRPSNFDRTASGATSAYGRLLPALKAWAEEHNVAIYPDAPMSLSATERYVPRNWVVQANESYRPDYLNDHTCVCGNTVSIRRYRCPSCSRELKCRRCHTFFLGLIETDGELCCAQHRVQCRHCGIRYHRDTYHGCSECVPRGPCSGPNCTREVERGYGFEHGDGYYCHSCWRTRCPQCHRVTGEATSGWPRHPITNYRICPPCHERVDAESSEEDDPTAAVSATGFLLESTSERPIRICSIEQEFCGGSALGNHLALQLHSQGLSRWPELVHYHPPAHRHPCHVETDSSVNGGELVYNRLRLDTQEDAGHLHRILSLVRAQDNLQINVRCGLHIHVDLHGYNLTDARHLAMVFNYLEDPLYRLASARYAGHRVALAGTQYAMSPPKGRWANNQRFGQEFLLAQTGGNGHHHALNLEAFYRSMRERCRCGVGQFGEDWSQCECENLGKCTAEWRIFNGTSNPLKMLAYISLAQSLTSWAQSRNENPEDYPELAFRETVQFTDGTSSAERELIEEWKPRLEWMFQNLHFAGQEKLALLYCIQNSDLRFLGDEFINHLSAITRTPETRFLTVRYGASRDGADPNPAPDGLSAAWNNIAANIPPLDYLDEEPEEVY